MGEWDRSHVMQPHQVEERSKGISGWTVKGDQLSRTFEFDDFAEAFHFMTKVAKIAEELDHHPDWANSWNKVEITVTNHQAGGITEIDFVLCERIDKQVTR